MGTIRSYRDLIAWQKARALVKSIYVLAERFPKHELYGLTQQVRRAGVSVPSNIAEGYGRGTRKDYVHFLHAARGSLYEVETQLFLAQDLGYLPESVAATSLERIAGCSKLLHGLIASLQRDA